MKIDLDQDPIESIPSNAAKFAPHSKRSFRNHSSLTCASRVASNATKVTKRPRTEFESESEVIDDESKMDVATPEFIAKKSLVNKVNRLLADEITRHLDPESHRRRTGDAAYRKIRSELNRRLTEKGFLIEPLLCSNAYDQIDFMKASKGSLTKNTKAIKRRPDIQAKWLIAMSKSSKAVNDIDSLFDAITSYNDEINDEVKFFPLRLNKAIETVKASRQELVQKAQKIVNAADGKNLKISELVVPVAVIIDTTSCDARDVRLSLILAGYISARSQDQTHIVIDGVLKPLFTTQVDTTTGEEVSVAVPWETLDPVVIDNDMMIDDGDIVDIAAVVPNSALTRLEQSLDLYFQNQVHVSFENKSIDVILYCRQVDHLNENQEQFIELIKQFQTTDRYRGLKLRTLRLHRLKPVFIESTEGVLLYQPRHNRPELPSNPNEVTADIVFIVDFTGSMSPYMDAVKRELVSIINTLKQSTGVGKIRVAFIGYRDFGDTDRIVQVDFKEQSLMSLVLDTIRGQSASGGGDAPEDLLSAMVAARTLSWSSHIRLSVIITDAEGKLFTSFT